MRRSLWLLLVLSPLRAMAGSLEVVTSWEELRARPAHEVVAPGSGDKLVVRLGVSSLRCSRSGAVQLWALVRGPQQAARSDSPGALGPLQVAFPEEPRRLLSRQLSRIESPRVAGERLYTRLVSARQRAFRLELRDAAGRALESTWIDVHAHDNDGWLRLTEPRRAAKQQLAAGPDALRAERVSLVGARYALPRIERHVPLLAVDRRGPLPIALPVHPSRGVELRVVGGRLRLRLPRHVPLFGASSRLLARCWIDGRPLAGTRDGRAERGLAKELLALGRGYDLALELPAAAGARVEIQLLWCPEGWQRHERGKRIEQLQMLRERAVGDDGLPLLSPRVRLR